MIVSMHDSLKPSSTSASLSNVEAAVEPPHWAVTFTEASCCSVGASSATRGIPAAMEAEAEAGAGAGIGDAHWSQNGSGAGLGGRSLA
jgi:hypothetical protein